MKRTLSLKRETLSSLTPDELAGVHGGAALSDPHVVCQYVEPNTALCSLRNTRCLCP